MVTRKFSRHIIWQNLGAEDSTVSFESKMPLGFLPLLFKSEPKDVFSDFGVICAK